MTKDEEGWSFAKRSAGWALCRRAFGFNPNMPSHGSRSRAFPASVNPYYSVAETADEMMKELFEEKPGLELRFRRRLLWRHPLFKLQMRLERLFQ